MIAVTTTTPPDRGLFNRRRRERESTASTTTFRIRRMSGTGRSILIVEDEFLIAADLEAQIREDGGRIARIALSIDAAHAELRKTGDVAGVVLDVNVAGTPSFGLADALVKAGMPFVFFTGYSSISMPDRFVGVPRIAKPATWPEIRTALAEAKKRVIHAGLGSFRDSVEAALPVLRQRARDLARNPEEADRLVEHALERAISAVGSRSLRLTIEDWLLSLLERSTAEKDGRMLH